MSTDNRQDVIEKPRRSLESKRFAHVTFVCRTRRKVDIFWLNFNGQKIKYATLTTGKKISFNTFHTHPWVFRDADTFDVLVANNCDEYYYPQPYIGEEEKPVTVDTPGNFCL